MQEGFHRAAGIVDDLGHSVENQSPEISYTRRLANGDYVQVYQHTLPPPAGFVAVPHIVNVPMPFFWDHRDAHIWGDALQQNARSGSAPSNWAPPLHPQYDLPPYSIVGAIPQHGPYPSSQDMHPFSAPAPSPPGRNKMRPTNQQWRTPQNENKREEADLNPPANLGPPEPPFQKESKETVISGESNTDDTSRSMDADRQSIAGQADPAKKLIRPKDDSLSHLEPSHFSRGDTQQSSNPSKALNADSAVFQPSSAPVPMKPDTQKIPSSPLDRVSAHSTPPVSKTENTETKVTNNFREILGESSAPNSHDTPIGSSSEVSDKYFRANEDVTTSSSSVYSHLTSEQPTDQAWQIYSKKNKKFGKSLPATDGNFPTSFEAEKIQSNKAQRVKDEILKYTTNEEHKGSEVSEEDPQDQMASGSRSDLNANKATLGKVEREKKKNKKKKKKSANKSKAVDEDVDDEVLNTVPYLAPNDRSVIQKIIWDMVAGDDPTPLRHLDLNRPLYNKIFTLDSRVDPLREHVLEKLMGQHLEELASKVSVQEANRRFFALQGQVIEDNRLVNWQLHRWLVGEPVRNIISLLEGEEKWPVFYNAKPDDWKVVEKQISELSLQSKNQLELAMPRDIRAKRLAIMYASGQVNKKRNRMMYSEEELATWAKQGVSAALLMRIGDILELTSPTVNWETLSEAAMGLKAKDLFNSLKGGIVIDGRLIYKEPVPWYTSGARMLILKDPKFSTTFNVRLKRMVDFGEDRVTVYDETKSTEGPKLGLPMGNKEDEKPVEEVDKEKNIVPKLGPDGILTLAEHMISNHFGIPAKQLVDFKRKIRFKNLVLKVKSNTNRIGGMDEKHAGVTWPKSASKELAPLKSQFRDFYNYWGITLHG